MKLTWKDLYNIASVAKKYCDTYGSDLEKELITLKAEKLKNLALKFDYFEIKGTNKKEL